ncbi:hypothetical protein KDAU_20900 [Dictyobacter aurantiacus]|uniref:Uncharacterized protein n=1 Tax=Dictyobacter aurantiacus TaxID=1936993 RepID=A0A401ZCZ1_9CHLR|nr:hypothetical protein KDAU_20900 [Dictyobacter aurantiacus]
MPQDGSTIFIILAKPFFPTRREIRDISVFSVARPRSEQNKCDIPQSKRYACEKPASIHPPTGFT